MFKLTANNLTMKRLTNSIVNIHTNLKSITNKKYYARI